MENVHIESLVLTKEGRRLLGQITAAEGLASIVGHHLSMLDISEDWKWEIESARLEKLRDMERQDGDAVLLYKEADKIMQRMVKSKISIDNAKTLAVPDSLVESSNFNA